jgi:hypothetical protein
MWITLLQIQKATYNRVLDTITRFIFSHHSGKIHNGLRIL